MNEDELLDALGQRFLSAVERHQRGDVDGAEDLLRALLKEEPRLGEPRLLLGRVLLDTDRLQEAEDQTREALEHLEQGIWLDEVPENAVLAIGHAQLAEILRRVADEDDVIFGAPERFHALLTESREHFAKAAELDPSDATSSYYAFFMGPANATSAGASEASPADDTDLPN